MAENMVASGVAAGPIGTTMSDPIQDCEQAVIPRYRMESWDTYFLERYKAR